MQKTVLQAIAQKCEIDLPLVSVIVPTFNSSSTLEACLRAIKLQTYPYIEIIIVDNYSKDGTVSISKKFTSSTFQTKKLRSAARNYGAKKASGSYLIFVDADMQLSPAVIQECVEKSIESRADAIMIPEMRVGTGFWAKCRALERLTYIGDPLIESARFIRKDLFADIGGFDEQLEAGEDYDLHSRIECRRSKITSINAFIKHHEGNLTIARLIMKRYYYGKTLMRYVKKHPQRSMMQFAPVRLDYIKKWRLLASDPLHASGLFFLKMLEYFVTSIALFFHLSEVN